MSIPWKWKEPEGLLYREKWNHREQHSLIFMFPEQRVGCFGISLKEISEKI